MLRGERVSVSVSGDWRLAIGDWRLATGDWRLATGDWRLAIGDWRLAIGDWRVFSFQFWFQAESEVFPVVSVFHRHSPR